MPRAKAKAPAYTDADLIAALGGDLTRWAGQCHAASIALVKSGAIGEYARVARGTCVGIASQHSWVVVGRDCYDPKARIIDPTLWSYDRTVEGIWHGTAADGKHAPHGSHGTIWDYGRPADPTGPIITLTPSKPLSYMAERFLELLGPLDLTGWRVLVHAPVTGWPAAEIHAAIYETPDLGQIMPIDLLGMLTDHNPGGLYLAA